MGANLRAMKSCAQFFNLCMLHLVFENSQDILPQENPFIFYRFLLSMQPFTDLSQKRSLFLGKLACFSLILWHCTKCAQSTCYHSKTFIISVEKKDSDGLLTPHFNLQVYRSLPRNQNLKTSENQIIFQVTCLVVSLTRQCEAIYSLLFLTCLAYC